MKAQSKLRYVASLIRQRRCLLDALRICDNYRNSVTIHKANRKDVSIHPTLITPWKCSAHARCSDVLCIRIIFVQRPVELIMLACATKESDIKSNYRDIHMHT